MTSLDAVVRAGLCTGCGACAYLQPQQIKIVDVPSEGKRPVALNGSTALLEPGDGIDACPGIRLEHHYDRKDSTLNAELMAGWGPVKSLFEGYAADAELRFSGSSGGAASALALFALEAKSFHGVLHTAARADVPYLNETVVSRSRDDLARRTGSRYAPASPCDGLDEIERGTGPYMLIAKPCDVAAAQNARKVRRALDRNLDITVAFFCAGTPSTEGTLAMLAAMGVPDPSKLVSLRYRGNGWPGHATATIRDAQGVELQSQLTYQQSWGAVLSKHVQWRCRLCADHTGEFADIAVGDPWYREIQPNEAGSSLIVVRTEKGARFVEEAIAKGYLIAAPVQPGLLPASQPNLLRTRGAIWGRITGLRLIGALAPRYVRMPTFSFWLRKLSLKEKVASFAGTISRCLRKKLHPLQRRSRESI
jgi:coenzyme F420 hydrogenase subunit beta